MNRYIMIRRLRWPAILVLAGVVALLDQMGAIEHFWSLFIPLLLILLGGLMLAERAVLASEGDFPPYPGGPYAGAADPLAAAQQGAAPQSAQPGTAIVPANQSYEIEREGGQR